jgi:hypothetical protein
MPAAILRCSFTELASRKAFRFTFAGHLLAEPSNQMPHIEFRVMIGVRRLGTENAKSLRSKGCPTDLIRVSLSSRIVPC